MRGNPVHEHPYSLLYGIGYRMSRLYRTDDCHIFWSIIAACKEVVDVELIGAVPTKGKASFRGEGVYDSQLGMATVAPADNLSKVV